MDDLSNNFYVVKHLISEIRNFIEGSILVDCFSQSKQEFIFQFQRNDTLRSLTFFAGSYRSFVFWSQKHKPNKNIIQQFQALYQLKVYEVNMFDNDRSFYMILDNDQRLVFKLYGGHANIIHFNSEQPLKMIKQQFKGDHDKLFSAYHQSSDQSYEHFYQLLQNGHEVKTATKTLFPAFTKDFYHWLENYGIAELQPDQQWQLIQQLLDQLNKKEFLLADDPDYAHKYDPSIKLTVLEKGTILNRFSLAEDALAAYAKAYLKNLNLLKEREQILQNLKNQRKNLQKSLKSSEQRLDKLMNDQDYRTMGDLIMAHLHEIESGSTEVAFNDFYSGKPVKIPLKRELSPQENAERFYKKSKNQGIELEKLEEKINHYQQEMERVEYLIDEVDNASSLKVLNDIKSQLKTSRNKKLKEQPSTPYRQFTWNDYKILVGKGAKSNDEVTFKYGSKKDLWLHAKDQHGSHVIVKNKGSEHYPKEIIEKAAQLAAYYSKGKGEAMCPILYTLRKHVWKPRGADPGQVNYKFEEVLLAEPQQWAEAH